MNENLSEWERFVKASLQTLTKQPLRGFEVVSTYLDKNINLPVRGTKYSAGYDFEAAEDAVIPSIYKTDGKPVMVPTGVKVYMLGSEYLQLHARSSLCKKGISLANSVGIIDSDFYNNPDNEGNVHFPLWCFGQEDVHIKKGERIGQGVFQRYLIADQDTVLNNERVGGFGSTSK